MENILNCNKGSKENTAQFHNSITPTCLAADRFSNGCVTVVSNLDDSAIQGISPFCRRNDKFLCVISKESSTEISHVQFVHLSYIWDFSFDDSVEMTLIFGISPRKPRKRGKRDRPSGRDDNYILTILSNKGADDE